MSPKKRNIVAAVALTVIIIAGIVTGILIGHFIRGNSPSPAALKAAAREKKIHLEILTENTDVNTAESYLRVSFPSRLGAPSPRFTNSIFKPSIKRHAVVGYVPSFELGSVTPQDLSSVSVVCYDGVDVGSSGGIVHDQNFSLLTQSSVQNLITTSHQDNDLVLLTAYTSSNPVIASITKHPATSAANLSAELVPIFQSDHFDGVSIDIEGQYAKERAGFVSFVKDFYHDMKTADPTAFILLDTYTDSAANPDNFYNVSELYPFVNDIFIMGYDMNTLSTASPNAPLINENLGNSDVQSLLSYTSVVPPQKLILGIPFYGYDFTTKDPYPYSPTKNSYPVAVTWDSILSVGRPQLWDPMSLTPWYRFKTGKTWHQTWFDNPVSIALKTALANEFHLGGVGVWALGMNGGDTQMLQALAGGRAPYKKQQILEASKATKSKKRKVAKR